ncbi:hypothetical protein Baya_0982 [Bagarius yarrelli]|uniref:Uncharacterized protein n=1 Tax=Bagarius yarrelli TaxID=175774 RepID=A0A556TJT3_BAGYA|nr:hypothetical protein Baya_0982 [Bagarius yarrelli]
MSIEGRVKSALMEVVTRAEAKLYTDWVPETYEARPHSRLENRFSTAKVQGPIFPVSTHREASYSNLADDREHGYQTMLKVEQTLARYRSLTAASFLGALKLPTKPLTTAFT